MTATERVICTLPEPPITALSEHCEGTRLSVGVAHAILGIDVASGAVAEIYRVPDPDGYGGHVRWSHTSPHLLSYGQVDHPHVGWDRKGRQVVFTSHRLGNPDLCVAAITGPLTETVARFVRATKNHEVGNDADAGVMADVDLSVLGRDERRFMEFEERIRREYAWVPGAVFGSKRGRCSRAFSVANGSSPPADFGTNTSNRREGTWKCRSPG